MILAIATNKGGVLKTTTTVNLASVLYNRGRRVLIVDMDNQGNAAEDFGLDPDDVETSVYHALTGKEHADDCIYRIIGEEPAGPCIDLMPSGDDLVQFELGFLADRRNWADRFNFLKRMLQPVAVDYDAVLIDSPPNIGITVGNILTAAHGVVVPYLPERHGLRALRKILYQVRDFTAENERLEFVGVFPVRVDNRTKQHALNIEKARDYCEAENVPMFNTVIPHSIRFANAVEFDDVPLALLDPEDELSRAYAALWDEIETKSRTGKRAAL